MSKEAMKLALEALELVIADAKTTPSAYEAQRQAITALREALAEQPAQQEPVAWMDDDGNLHREEPPYKYGPDPRPLVFADTSPQPAPVQQCRACFGMGYVDGKGDKCLTCNGIGDQPAQQQPAQQEPVAWVEGVEIYWRNAPDLNDWIRQNGQPLYTTPPAAQRQWVGLSDEEVYPLANQHLHYQMEGYEVSGIYNLARAIEAKLKEKNNE